MLDQLERAASAEQQTSPKAVTEEWVNGSIGSVDKQRQAARDRVLALLDTPPGDQTGEWEWSVETLRDLQTALKAKLLSEQNRPGLNADLLEGATQAFRKFILHVPLLHLADPKNFESQLCEFFSEAMQSVDEKVRLAYVDVCMKAFDHWLLRDCHERFVRKTVPDYARKSPFREEILKWGKQYKDEVKNKKATFPIMEALSARLIEINTVLKPAKREDAPFHDDWLVEEVEKVCATSRPFAHDLFGLGIIKINASGGFDHVREKLIEINERRKKGLLRAHTYTDFAKISATKEDLLDFIKILIVAYEKLSDQLEASHITLSQTLGTERADKQKLIKAHEKTNQELRKLLAVEIANSADKSRVEYELKSMKEKCLEQDIVIQRLTAELKKEKQLRAQTEEDRKSLHHGYQNTMTAQESTHAAALEEERRTSEALLAEERQRSQAALQEQRLKYEAALAKLSRKTEDPMTTPKKTTYFFDASKGALSPVQVDTDSDTANKPFSMTYSPGGSDVIQ